MEHQSSLRKVPKELSKNKLSPSFKKDVRKNEPSCKEILTNDMPRSKEKVTQHMKEARKEKDISHKTKSQQIIVPSSQEVRLF